MKRVGSSFGSLTGHRNAGHEDSSSIQYSLCFLALQRKGGAGLAHRKAPYPLIPGEAIKGYGQSSLPVTGPSSICPVPHTL